MITIEAAESLEGRCIICGSPVVVDRSGFEQPIVCDECKGAIEWAKQHLKEQSTDASKWEEK